MNVRHGFAALLLAAVVAAPVDVAADPPAQATIYVGSDVPVSEGGPSVAIAAYSWSTGSKTSLSLYAGPHWNFFSDRLGFELKAGAYADAVAQPVLNAELMWEDGNLELDWFNDVYWPAGAYSWLSGKYWFGPLFVGAMADSTIERSNFELNAGPMFGAGRSSFDVGVAPLYSNLEGFVLRVLINVEFADQGDKKAKSPAKELSAARDSE